MKGLRIQVEEDKTLTVSKQELLDYFSREALGGILRAFIHINRLRAFMLIGGGASEAEEWLNNRIRSAALVIAINSMRDAAEAVRDMRNHGIPDKLTWSKEIWKKLSNLADRWLDRNDPRRQLRNVLIHPDGRKLVAALKSEDVDRFVLLKTIDETGRTSFYEGADTLPFVSWRLQMGKTTFQNLRSFNTKELVPDIYAFSDYVEAVVADAMGSPPPEDSEIEGRLNTRERYQERLTSNFVDE